MWQLTALSPRPVGILVEAPAAILAIERSRDLINT